MRIILTTFITALLYILITSLDFHTNKNAGDIILTFWLILIPILLEVCLFHLLLVFYKWTKKRPTILFQISVLFIINNLILFLVTLPDYVRHQTDPTYNRYDSYWSFFKKDVLEAVITATCFSIIIPLLDIYIKQMLLAYKKSSK